MVATISKWILKIFGWKEVGAFPEGNKFVVVAAPHTSMWDFVWGRLYYNSIHKSVRFMIKEKYFFFPLGMWIKALGAIPVKMDRKHGLVDQMIEEFSNRDEFLLTITPEATRKKVNRWKRGFYHIASGAKVPIVLGYIDYKNKKLGVLDTIQISDNIESDLEMIRLKYYQISGKHPEKYNREKI